jgi:hypothetical protein
MGRYAEAVEVFRQGLQYAAQDPGLNRRLAWLLATCPADEVRDGEEALRLAQAAREAHPSPSSDPHILDTLAAAYAESGDCIKAGEIAEQAIQAARAGDAGELVSAIEERKHFYLSGQPFRESGQ